MGIGLFITVMILTSPAFADSPTRSRFDYCPEKASISSGKSVSTSVGCEGSLESGNPVLGSLVKAVEEITRPNREEIACIGAAQKSSAIRSSEFRSCPSGHKFSASESRCRSFEVASTAARALNLVSECVGIRREDLFLVVAASTGFVPDAISSEVENTIRSVIDVDLGLVGDEVARETGNLIRKKMKDTPFCSGLSQIETDFRLKDGLGVCERITGPFLPLIYQAKAFRYRYASLDAIRSGLDSSKNRNRLRSRFGSEEEYRLVLRSIAIMSVKIGDLRAQSIFFARLHRPFRDAKDFLSQYRSEVARIDPEAARLEETTRETNRTIGGAECFSR